MVSERAPPLIDLERCTACGLCVQLCPSFVLEGGAGTKPSVKNPHWCIACDHCGAACPAGAVSFPGRPLEKPRGATASADALQQLLRSRRSVRLYRDEPVSDDLLRQALEAGRYAPTGSNRQNVRYLVFTDPRQIKALRDRVVAFYAKIFKRVQSPLGSLLIRLAAGAKTLEVLRGYLPLIEHFKEKEEGGEDRLFFNAPVIVLVHAEAWDTCSAFNCAAALFACALKAHALGLGTCFNGFLQGAAAHDRALRKWLSVPRDHQVYAAMTLGWPEVTFKLLVTRREPVIRWK